MTITFQKPTAAIYRELFCAASLRGGVPRIVQAGVADLEDTVPEQILRSQPLGLTRQARAKVFAELEAQLDLLTPHPASLGILERLALQRCGRIFQ
jgi:hypothetical protein